MKKGVVVAAVFSLLFLSCGPVATGDGGYFGKYASGVELIFEESQYAVIDYQDGTESMFLKIKTQSHLSKQSLWIVPVPTNETEIAILDRTPALDGIEVEDRFIEEHTHLYMAYLMYLGSVLPGAILYLMVSNFGGDTGTLQAGIDVYQYIEYKNISAESLSADSGENLFNYLSNKGFDIPVEYQDYFQDYIDDGFSFVIAWVGDGGTPITHPALWIKFPADRIYFPMKLTSIYDEDLIDIDLFVKGHVEFSNKDYLKNQRTSTYYHYGKIVMVYQYYTYGSSEFKEEFKTGWDGTYTHIHISSQARNFTEDIWLVPLKDRQSSIQKFAEREYGLIFFPLVYVNIMAIPILLSYAFFNFRGQNKNNRLVLGFSHIFGPLGLIFGTIYVWSNGSEKTWKYAVYYFLTVVVTLLLFSVLNTFLKFLIRL